MKITQTFPKYMIVILGLSIGFPVNAQDVVWRVWDKDFKHFEQGSYSSPEDCEGSFETNYQRRTKVCLAVQNNSSEENKKNKKKRR